MTDLQYWNLHMLASLVGAHVSDGFAFAFFAIQTLIGVCGLAYGLICAYKNRDRS